MHGKDASLVIDRMSKTDSSLKPVNRFDFVVY